ncbi:MAG: hypothetical protein FWD14_00850 [Treponema sp.]|nr:hypothetical protein [Treponema sp.]
MFRFLNKIIFLPVFVFLSCGFADLRPIGLLIEPGVMDSVLAEIYSPVMLKFNTEVIKNEIEGILQINSDYGSVKGDYSWKGNALLFVPVQGWIPGVRYTLSLNGSIRSADGREMRIERFIPFFAVSRNSPPVLEHHLPFNGASVGTNNVILEFYFSRSMNRFLTESALTLEGIGNKIFEWSDDGRILKVIAENALSPWNIYRWSLKDSAKCFEGIPLPKTYSGHFLTDLDKILPSVVNVYPVLFSDGSWYPTGMDIETGLGFGQGIAVSFNKPMGESALRSLRFEPSLTGRTEFLSEDSIVFIFSREIEPEIIYTLIVSGETKDSEGLKTGADYKVFFKPDIPYLNILSVIAGSGSVFDEFTFLDFSETNIVLPVHADSATGELFFSIRFSHLFELEEKQISPQKIILSPFFPRTLAPVALQYVTWISDDRLFLRWEGLISANDEENSFYKLLIPGGRGGINAGKGINLKQDIVFYLEVRK